MKYTFLIVSAVLFSVVATAQNESFKGERFIEVTGVAHQEVDPNEIFVMIRLREYEENRAKVALEKLEKDLYDALKRAGIDRKRLEIADAGSQIGGIKRRDKEAFRVKTFQLKLTSADEVDKLMNALDSVTVDYADITRVSHSDIEKFRRDLKVKALQAAREKADYLLKSIGSTVGKPLMVRDWDQGIEQPMLQANVMYRREVGADGVMDAGEEAPAFRKIKLQAQITAQFGIE